MSTKKDLEKKNADMRQQILDLKSELATYKKVDPDNIDNEFDQVGVGVNFVDGQYKIVELRYNRELGTGIVFAEHDSGPNIKSRPLLEQNSIQFLLENIVDIL